jgi:hypothetical protein
MSELIAQWARSMASSHLFTARLSSYNREAHLDAASKYMVEWYLESKAI